MKRAVFVSVHYWGSKRKAGFHWLADALWRDGWDVTFVTAAVSWLSVLRRDHRMDYDLRSEANRLITARERLHSYVWFTPFHPVNLRRPLLNTLSRPVFGRYGALGIGALTPKVRQADLFVFESTAGLLLFDRFRRLNPRARTVYRVSDDLRLLKVHPVIVAAERRLAPRFDLVSVPSEPMQSLFPGLRQVRVHRHGIRTELFDRPWPNPYPRPQTTNVVFAGMPPFDTAFLVRAARMFPGWQWHIIGPLPGLPSGPSIHAYGEKPFEETVPFLVHADIGLHTPTWDPGVESRKDSLKVIQYTYCQLPIIAPDFMQATRSNVFAYRPDDDESIQAALLAARACERATIARDGIYSWDGLARELAGEPAKEQAGAA